MLWYNNILLCPTTEYKYLLPKTLMEAVCIGERWHSKCPVALHTTNAI